MSVGRAIGKNSRYTTMMIAVDVFRDDRSTAIDNDGRTQPSGETELISETRHNKMSGSRSHRASK